MNSKDQEQFELPASDAGVGSDVVHFTDQERDYHILTNRDPKDVQTILRLTRSTGVFALLSVMLAALQIYQITRPTAVIVIQREANGELAVVGPGQSSDQPGTIRPVMDQPGEGDKKHLATRVAELFYRIDPKTRPEHIAAALRAMTPEAAQALVAQAKQSGEWDQQKREEWQTVWTLQDVTIARNDSYQVHVIGLQEIRSTVNGTPQHRKRQLVFTLLLKADSAGRTYDNQNTGYRVAGIPEMKILDALDGAEARVRSPIAAAEKQPTN